MSIAPRQAVLKGTLLLLARVGATPVHLGAVAQWVAALHMIYSFVFGSMTAFIVGAALLMLWRNKPAIKFTRDIGCVYLSQAAMPTLYFAYFKAGAVVQTMTLLATFVCGVAYLAFLILAIAHRTGRELSKQKIAAIVSLLSVAAAYPLSQHNWSATSAVTGCITVGVGLVAWRWLWPSRRWDRWLGPLISGMGVIQFAQTVWGTEAIAAQVTANALIGLVLGLVLLHDALQCSTAAANRLRMQYAHLTESSPQGILLAYAKQNILCNPAFLRIYGLTSLAEVSPDWVNVGIAPDELSSIMKMRDQILEGSLAEAHWEGVRRRKDGTVLHLRFAAWRTEWNDQPALQSVIIDDTEHHETMAAMLFQANHDELTGLPNRGALLRRLRKRCEAQSPEGTFGLVLLDVDRFKLFNDAHGHSMGDEILKALAVALERGLSDIAEVSRLGSDGFAVLTFANVSQSQVDGVAQRVRQIVAFPLVLPAHEFFVDVSMGIALFPQTAKDAESLLRAANAAMHQAKSIPGTSIVEAEQRYERGSSEVLAQEQALRAGIAKREFTLVYQPKVDSISGALVGFEALARWHRDGIPKVSPVQFIAAAERTGLINSLGMLLLSQACGQIADWRRQTSNLVPVAVNVSSLQMLDPGFLQLVQSALQAYRIPAELITLEITESAAIANMEQTRAQLVQLGELGIEVAMDDFGAGFSSLGVLRSLPLSAIKIDQSLIAPLPAPDAVAVVQAICQLAATLKLRVVAEGVETGPQAQAALQAGCQEIQGYFYAQPLSPELALCWLKAGKQPGPIKSTRLNATTAQPTPPER